MPQAVQLRDALTAFIDQAQVMIGNGSYWPEPDGDEDEDEDGPSAGHAPSLGLSEVTCRGNEDHPQIGEIPPWQ